MRRGASGGAGLEVFGGMALEMARPTTLHKAAAKGNVAEVRRLVRTGADVNKRGENGVTALHVAAQRG